MAVASTCKVLDGTCSDTGAAMHRDTPAHAQTHVHEHMLTDTPWHTCNGEFHVVYILPVEAVVQI